MSSTKEKRDFRKGNDAKKRTEEAKQIILNVLSREEAIFKVLIAKTGLSRPALTSNLEKLNNEAYVKWRPDPNDHRKGIYSITDDGRKSLAKLNYLKRWEPIESVSVDEGMEIIKELIATTLSLLTLNARVIDNLGDNVIAKNEKNPASLTSPPFPIRHDHIAVKDKRPSGSLSKVSFRLGQCDDNVVLPALSERGRQVLGGCLEDSVDHRTVDDEPIGLVEAIGELLEAINMVTAMKSVDIERLKRLPNLKFTFRFNRDKLIQQYEFFKNNPDFLKSDLVFLGKRRRSK